MKDLSEQTIKEDCPHCDPDSFALKHPLKETDNFWIVCDVHPLRSGHLLIIPKQHFSCIGEYPEILYLEFAKLYGEFSKFLKSSYDSVGTFEHGKIGQTVFHSHVHLLPFSGKSTDIVPEGQERLRRLISLAELKKIYQEEEKYLFFSLENELWVVDLNLGVPRFFRDRFARALGKPEIGNWKSMHENKELMEEARKDIEDTEMRWKNYLVLNKGILS